MECSSLGHLQRQLIASINCFRKLLKDYQGVGLPLHSGTEVVDSGDALILKVQLRDQAQLKLPTYIE
ncbi:hypothetical protein MKW98_026983 [Papaver atlanticum]|uniref:Uncharacterized protein n=1 Tax=Papaver atlanticum TaxID=357466 RepID=A0AAD4STR2_9MAGN|nr:hypothetical protein MKW98_026983 [Papaver atlanticum]